MDKFTVYEEISELEELSYENILKVYEKHFDNQDFISKCLVEPTLEEMECENIKS